MIGDSTASGPNIEGSWDKLPDGPAVAADGGGLAAMLRGRGLLAEEALQRALLIERESGERLEAVVTRLGMISEDRLAAELARFSGLAAIGADGFPAAPVEGPELSVAFLRDMRAIPVAIDPVVVRIAVSNPFDSFAAQAFGFMFQRRVERVIGRASDIDVAIERLYHGVRVHPACAGPDRPQPA